MSDETTKEELLTQMLYDTTDAVDGMAEILVEADPASSQVFIMADEGFREVLGVAPSDFHPEESAS